MPENLYASGAPVIISAGALLKDIQTGKVLAQLKLKNIAVKTLKAARVSIFPFDTIGNPLGAAIEYRYLDLSVKRDEEFGVQSPIILPDAATRVISVTVIDVAFSDNTFWKANNVAWETLPEPKELVLALKNREIANQLQINYKNCRYEPETHKDLWYCTCSAINRQSEDSCHHCGRSLSALMAIDLAELREECNKHLAAEAKKVAEEKAAVEARAKQRKKTAAIIISIAIVTVVVGGLFKQIMLPKIKYNQACSLLENGQYREAITAFEAMDGYKDSTGQIDTCKELALKNAKIGDYLFFGAYEQDNYRLNGKEEIEWLVLDRQGDNILVISKYALDHKPYTEYWGECTWEECSLRKWLNNEFVNTAFSDAEKVMISTVAVSADKNSDSDADPGNATKDQVFLLSIAEVNKYFSSFDARQCEPTDYAVANGVFVKPRSGNCLWWLRSLGKDQWHVAYVSFTSYSDGGINVEGASFKDNQIAVRPAMWIDLDKLNIVEVKR